MATLKRTHRWFAYCFAIVIGTGFSLFGKTIPSWAQETQQNYHARIFQESIGPVAQADGQAGDSKGRHVVGRKDDRTVAGQRMLSSPHSSEGSIVSKGLQKLIDSELLKRLEGKKLEDLTLDELMILKMLWLEDRLNRLSLEEN